MHTDGNVTPKGHTSSHEFLKSIRSAENSETTYTTTVTTVYEQSGKARMQQRCRVHSRGGNLLEAMSAGHFPSRVLKASVTTTSPPRCQQNTNTRQRRAMQQEYHSSASPRMTAANCPAGGRTFPRRGGNPSPSGRRRWQRVLGLPVPIPVPRQSATGHAIADLGTQRCQGLTATRPLSGTAMLARHPAHQGYDTMRLPGQECVLCVSWVTSRSLQENETSSNNHNGANGQMSSSRADEATRKQTRLHAAMLASSLLSPLGQSSECPAGRL